MRKVTFKTSIEIDIIVSAYIHRAEDQTLTDPGCPISVQDLTFAPDIDQEAHKSMIDELETEALEVYNDAQEADAENAASMAGKMDD